MEYKQEDLIKTILERISSGVYAGSLPRAVDLAEEFQVNVKTVNKAILRLVKQGVLERKRHSGTRVVAMPQNATEPVVEIMFDGFTAVFSHPFWRQVWEAMIEGLAAAGFRAVLTMLKSDAGTGLLNFNQLSFFPAAGRVILGSYEKILLDRALETGAPFLAACDPLDEAVPQVSFDFSKGIGDAVGFLYQKGCRKIGFIGQTQSLIHPRQLNKFHAYLNALQNYCQVDPACVGGTRPVPGGGAAALEGVLRAAAPDALIVAYDSQLPEILGVLREKGVAIPVIGCDGLELPGVPENRPVVRAPLGECGRLAAEKIVQAIHARRKPKSVYLEAKFDPGE